MDICRLKMNICKLQTDIFSLKMEFIAGVDRFYGMENALLAAASETSLPTLAMFTPYLYIRL